MVAQLPFIKESWFGWKWVYPRVVTFQLHFPLPWRRKRNLEWWSLHMSGNKKSGFICGLFPFEIPSTRSYKKELSPSLGVFLNSRMDIYPLNKPMGIPKLPWESQNYHLCFGPCFGRQKFRAKTDRRGDLPFDNRAYMGVDRLQFQSLATFTWILLGRLFRIMYLGRWNMVR